MRMYDLNKDVMSEAKKSIDFLLKSLGRDMNRMGIFIEIGI